VATKKKKATKRVPAKPARKPARKPVKKALAKVAKKKSTKKRNSLTAELIRRAETTFLKDEEAHSVDWHFKEGDYEKYVSLDTFRSWSTKFRWVPRRIEYWEGIQQRLLNHLADQILDQKIKELGAMTEVKDTIVELLQPLKDSNGKIQRDPATRLPKFAVDLPPYDRLVKAFLDLDMRIGLRTGEATSRIDTVGHKADADAGTTRQLLSPEESSGLMKITPDEAKSLARKLLMERNEHLEDDVIDAEYEVTDEHL
jgi:hypothetical protein